MAKLIFTESGFTLIELIAVLLISGILVLVASLGITGGVKGYLSAKTNSETAYRGQIAMMRLSKEFKKLTSVAPGQSNSSAIVYDTYRNGAIETHKISWGGTGDPLLYDDFSNNGNILVDQVKTFSLAYYDAYNDLTPETAWSTSTRLIGFRLALIGTDNIASEFTGKIAPRNLP
jgi:prepilin-type N-terminal cleavage/methylation domain-containing protein